MIDRFKVKKIDASLARQIVMRMNDEGYSDAEIDRFLHMWHETNRATSIMAWLSRPADDIDRRIEKVLRSFLLVDH
jgi:hypothetical protein